MEAQLKEALTAVLPNGGMGGGNIAPFYFVRNSGSNWAQTYDIESGALPLVETILGSRRRVEEPNTNLVTNPIVGVDLTGWTTVHSIARVSIAAEGLPALPDGLAGKVTSCIKVTFNGVQRNGAAQFTLAALVDTDHAFSNYLLIPSTFTGLARLERNGYIGATGTIFVDADASNVDDWQRDRCGSVSLHSWAVVGPMG